MAGPDPAHGPTVDSTLPAPLSRRLMLGGLLGVGAALTGCGRALLPAATDDPTVSAPPPPAATAESVTPRPSISTTPRPSPPATTRPATAAEIIKRATVPVLCYHQLRDWRAGDSAYERAELICPPTIFRRQLDALDEDGWSTIGPDDYLNHLQSGRPLPDKPVMLSFDDGQRSQIREGLPQLRRRQMTGTFFVMTVILGQPTWLTRDDVKRLADAGMTIGSHTWDHHAVTDYAGKDWRVQLEDSRETLATISGQPVRHFAYPFGAWDRRALPYVAEAGYATAFQLVEKPLDRRRPLLTLQRILVSSLWSGSQLLARLRA